MSGSSNVPDWAQIIPPDGTRRLPVYLLLDISGSMRGSPIESLQRGLEQLKQEVSDDPFNRDLVRVGIITFDHDARMHGGLSPIEEFSPPELVAGGVTRLDRAIEVLLESMDRDVAKPVKGGTRGDGKPIVFVLTDGRPTDAEGHLDDNRWRAAREALLNRPKGAIKPLHVVAVGCGTDVDDATLKDISNGTAFRMGTSEASFNALFRLVTVSVTSSAQSMQAGGVVVDPFADIPPSSDLFRIP